MSRDVPAFVVPPGGGEFISGPLGSPVRILTRAENTNGGLATFDLEIPPLQGPPEHIHVREDEAYYVLAGQVRVKADGRYFDALTGAFVVIPRGTPHCFLGVGDEPARLLVVFAPAGMERFFEGVATLPPGSLESEEYRQIAHASWMEVVGPPLTPGEGD